MSLCLLFSVSEDVRQWRGDRQRAEDQVQPALEQNSVWRPLQASSCRYTHRNTFTFFLMKFVFLLILILLLVTPLFLPSCLRSQREITSVAYWTRPCRLTRWWKTATTLTVTWSPCCVNQRTSSTPPFPLPTPPRPCRAARSVPSLLLFLQGLNLNTWRLVFLGVLSEMQMYFVCHITTDRTSQWTLCGLWPCPSSPQHFSLCICWLCIVRHWGTKITQQAELKERGMKECFLIAEV